MSNLPPGTTHADVDERMSSPDQAQIVGDVTVGFAVEAPYSPDEADHKKALLAALERGDWEDILDVEVRQVLEVHR